MMDWGDALLLERIDRALRFKARTPTHALPENMSLLIQTRDSHGGIGSTLRRDRDGRIDRGREEY
jgi:hypothetical protein